VTASAFRTVDGRPVPSVTAEEMRAVDRVAVEEVGLALLGMMENAGRTLAAHVRAVRAEAGSASGPVAVVAGAGGNGGGGLACARHLANRGASVRVVLDRPAEDLNGAPARQARILDAMGVPTTTDAGAALEGEPPAVVVDALIGYGLTGALRPPASDLVAAVNDLSAPTVSLDVPSGVDATTGAAEGVAVAPDRTVTLALPKPGLAGVDGRLFLADIGIPTVVYERAGVEYAPPFGDADWVELDA